MLSTLLTLALLTGGTERPALLPFDPGPALLTSLSGRSRLAREGGVVELQPRMPALSHRGPAYLELDPLAETTVSWSHRGSLRLLGPASVEWEPAGPDGALTWRFLSAGGVYVDLRLGTARVELPRGWRLELAPGLYFLESLPGGSYAFHCDAGAPARLELPPDVAGPSDALLVLPGGRVRLQADGGLRSLVRDCLVPAPDRRAPTAILPTATAATPPAPLPVEQAATVPAHGTAPGAGPVATPLEMPTGAAPPAQAGAVAILHRPEPGAPGIDLLAAAPDVVQLPGPPPALPRPAPVAARLLPEEAPAAGREPAEQERPTPAHPPVVIRNTPPPRLRLPVHLRCFFRWWVSEASPVLMQSLGSARRRAALEALRRGLPPFWAASLPPPAR